MGPMNKQDDYYMQIVPADAIMLLASSSCPYEQMDSATRQTYACNDLLICPLWMEIREHAAKVAVEEPLLGSYMFSTILNHATLPQALAFHLAEKLGDACFNSMQWHQLFNKVFEDYDTNWEIRKAIRDDLLAIRTRDAACKSLCDALLYYKGFLGLEAHRISHWLWLQGREDLARLLQARISTVFSMDIHPAAKLGSGLMFDHASGVVIGETTVVGDNCSFLHNVTLGGTGKAAGDRHPKLGSYVSVGAGVSILGNIKVGDNSKIGAGSVVLREVPENATVVGIPAKIVVPKTSSEPSFQQLSAGALEGVNEGIKSQA